MPGSNFLLVVGHSMSTGDYDIDSLATYLHLNPAQVRKMADRGRLPGRKIGGAWKFPAAEIHHWLEDSIGASDDDELARVEGVLKQASPGAKEISIADALPVEAMAVPLNARTRTSVINKMVQLAVATGWLWDPDKMAEAVSAREHLHSTALDIGVALLHPRRPQPNNLAQPFLAFGRTQRGIPFGDSRGRLTDVYFLILSTDDRGHLRTLARLSRLIGDPQLLEAIRTAETAADVHQAIADYEREQFG
jgi:PTS system nitrogen regulatory IIA component